MEMCNKNSKEAKKRILFKDLKPGQTFKWAMYFGSDRLDMKLYNNSYLIICNGNYDYVSGMTQAGDSLLDYEVTEVDMHCICKKEKEQ